MRVITSCLALCFVTGTLWAQAGGDRGSGSTPFGRQGAVWQTDIRIAQEELADLEADLRQLSEAEWMEKMLAWATYDFSEERRLKVDQSLRIASIDAGRRVEVKARETEEPELVEASSSMAEQVLFADEEEPEPAAAAASSWDLAWSKKPPVKLKLQLTDDEATKVECSLRSAKALGKGYLGVFLHKSTLLCMARGPFEA